MTIFYYICDIVQEYNKLINLPNVIVEIGVVVKYSYY